MINLFDDQSPARLRQPHKRAMECPRRQRYTLGNLQLVSSSEPAWVSYAIASVIFAGCFVVMFAFVFM